MAADIRKITSLMEQIEGFSALYIEKMATKELNGIQALMLMRLGDREETIGKLNDHYFGTNISYNVKKLIELNYISRKSGDTDRRIGIVSLTPKGKKVCKELEGRHAVFDNLMNSNDGIKLFNIFRELRELLDEGERARRYVR